MFLSIHTTVGTVDAQDLWKPERPFQKDTHMFLDRLNKEAASLLIKITQLFPGLDNP